MSDYSFLFFQLLLGKEGSHNWHCRCIGNLLSKMSRSFETSAAVIDVNQVSVLL